MILGNSLITGYKNFRDQADYLLLSCEAFFQHIAKISSGIFLRGDKEKRFGLVIRKFSNN